MPMYEAIRSGRPEPEAIAGEGRPTMAWQNRYFANIKIYFGATRPERM